MPGRRSRRGCEECRRRRRKCDENKPNCGQCLKFGRTCTYTLNLIWGGRRFKKSCFGDCLHTRTDSAERIDADNGGFVYGVKKIPEPEPIQALTSLPRSLPNGLELPARYRKLLDYFTKDILASLSTHPTIQEDLCKGLVPAMLQSPYLLTASLALSAAGCLSRGLTELDGVELSRMMEHLQSSGLSLLRAALGRGQKNELLLVTCLIWCLADIFAGQEGLSSWHIHLQGVQAILDASQDCQQLIATPASARSPIRHLYLLYLSLQRLPHLSSLSLSSRPPILGIPANMVNDESIAGRPQIDGFLGYSEELLDIIDQINQLSSSDQADQMSLPFEADILLGRLKAMIERDAQKPPDISISSGLSPEYNRNFVFCHKSFQHATLIHLYRSLYSMPSGSLEIQSCVETIQNMVENMAQGQPCNTWVAMSMPLFTIGCEALNQQQKDFVLDKIQKLESCLGSLHVRVLRQALRDVWEARARGHDFIGNLCANHLLKELPYSIVLF